MKADLLHKKMHGVVYTPPRVATSIARFCVSRVPSIATVLEPSCGDGAFVQALRKLKGGGGLSITAVDIDAHALDFASANDPRLLAINEDYLSFSRQTAVKYDLVIGNPPYVRRHNFSRELKESIKELSARVGYPESQLKNAWVAFIVASCTALARNGILAFIVPYELITVSYGKYLREWLAERYRRVDIFIPEQKAFREIDQDAVVLIATDSPTESAGSYLHSVKGLEFLGRRGVVAAATGSSDPLSDKSYLLDSKTRELLTRVRARTMSVGDCCDSSAGTVTAANEYFILSAREVEARGLQAWARRIVKKGAYVKSLPIFSNDDFDKLSASEPCFLIDFCRPGAPPLDALATSYIGQGEEAGFHRRYKARHRSPWYRIPVVPETGALFFKRSHKLPKFCLNEAGVLATDTAYQVKPKEGFKAEALCFSFYNSLTALFCEVEGRFYGGGVLELTPVEFRRLPLEYMVPTAPQFDEFCAVAKEGPEEMLSHGDIWLRHKLKLTDYEMEAIRYSLIVLQQHRLRHGNTSSFTFEDSVNLHTRAIKFSGE